TELDRELAVAERFLALRTSFEFLMAICNGPPEFLRFASLARVAREFGDREVAVKALSNLRQHVTKSGRVNAGEPFLAAGERFDHLDPKDAVGSWVLCSILEELERNVAFSSFYTGEAARPRL